VPGEAVSRCPPVLSKVASWELPALNGCFIWENHLRNGYKNGFILEKSWKSSNKWGIFRHAMFDDTEI
jgi:hypothetical protein